MFGLPRRPGKNDDTIFCRSRKIHERKEVERRGGDIRMIAKNGGGSSRKLKDPNRKKL